MKINCSLFRGAWPGGRRLLAASVVLVYGATNVVFCHAAEANFWSSRRTAARKMGQPSAVPQTGATDALILAQLPGGARLDFRGPAESSVVPSAPPTEHLVGGKIPVFESDLPRWLADVVTPYGNMRDVYLSKRSGAPLVIQIQDLHDSTEAQRNIAGLVESLHDERGVSLVGMEGAQGAFATEAFRSFPDADITKAVAEHFMEVGYLGGPEFAGITAKRMPLLWGVEDMKGYDANVAAVIESAKNRPVVDGFLREARRVMSEVKRRRLSVKLLEFDRHLTGYHLGKEPLGVYVRYLLKSSPQSMVSVPNVVLLRDALQWEDSLDFKRIESERTKLLERMVSALSKTSLEQLVAYSAKYRLGRVSYGDYYRFLRTLCAHSGIELEDYHQLSVYVRYVLLAERINRNDLLTELSALERAVQDGLTVSAEEKHIVGSARNLALLERLVAHSYTPTDWAYQVTHQIEIRNVGQSIVALAQPLGIPHTLSPPTADILQPYEEFCRQAVGRNAAMVHTLLEKMRAEKRATAVLVAGGFHTEGLTQLLRQKDVSYAVVTPKVNGALPEGHRTLDLLARDPAPLEKLFAGETVNIPTPRMTSFGNSNNGLVSKIVTLFAAFLLALHVFNTNVPAQLDANAQPLPGVVSAVARPTSQGASVSVVRRDGQENSFMITESLPSTPVAGDAFVAHVGGRTLMVRPQPKAWDVVETWGQEIISFWAKMPVRATVRRAWAEGKLFFRDFRERVQTILAGSPTRGATPEVGGAAFLTKYAPAVVKTPAVFVLGVLPAWAFASPSEFIPFMSDFSPFILLNPPGVLFLATVGWLIFQLVKRGFPYLGEKTSDFRHEHPVLYYTVGNLLRTIAFPALGIVFLSSVVSTTASLVWAIPALIIGYPLVRALKKGFNSRTIFAEIQNELKHTQDFKWWSHAGEAIILAGLFAILYWAIGISTAVILTSVVGALWDVFRPRGGAVDPWRPSFWGRAMFVWLLLTSPAGKITIAGGDGDNYSRLNWALSQQMVGTAPGSKNPKGIVIDKLPNRSLFWGRRIVLSDLVREKLKSAVYRWVGGDEYFLVLKGDPAENINRLDEVDDAFNEYGLIAVDAKDKPIDPDSPQFPRKRPRELFVSLPSPLSLGEIDQLKKMEFVVKVGIHAGQYKVHIDRSKTELSVDKIIEHINEKLGRQSGTAKEIQWNAPDGVADFTTTIGVSPVEHVIEILIIASSSYDYEKIGTPEGKQNFLDSRKKEWIGKSGRVRISKIPEIFVWGFRFANDTLRVAKGGSLTKDPPKDAESKTIGSIQARNRVYSLNFGEREELALSVLVTKDKMDEVRSTWWHGLFRIGRAGFDTLSRTLTRPSFHRNLVKGEYKYIYRIDVAGYIDNPKGTFYTSRAFHELQDNVGYANGNEIIKGLFSVVLQVFQAPKLSQTQVLLSRLGPDSVYVATNEEVTHQDLDRLQTGIIKRLNEITSIQGISWAPKLAIHSVRQADYELLMNDPSREGPLWPLGALDLLDASSEALKTLGSRNPLQKIGRDSFLEDVEGNKSVVRVQIPSALIELESLEKQFTQAELIQEEESIVALENSSAAKVRTREQKLAAPPVAEPNEKSPKQASESFFKRNSMTFTLIALAIFGGLSFVWWATAPAFPALMNDLWKHLVEILGSFGIVLGIQKGSKISRIPAWRTGVQLPVSVQRRIGDDLLLMRILESFNRHHANDLEREKKLDTILKIYQKVKKPIETHYYPGAEQYWRKLAETVAEWGGAEETIVAAMLGGQVIQNNLPEVEKKWEEEWGIDRELFTAAESLANRMVRAMRVPLSENKLDAGLIRNQMGFLLQGHLLKGNRDDQAVLLSMLASATWLKFAPSGKEGLARVIEYVNAPMAARFGQDYLETDLLDMFFLSTNPKLYRIRELEFLKSQGLSHAEAQQALEKFRALISKELGRQYPGVRVYARVKSIASINQKLKSDGGQIEDMTDLYGLAVIFPEGTEPDLEGVKRVLFEFGKENPKKTKRNEYLFRDYIYEKVVITASNELLPFGIAENVTKEDVKPSRTRSFEFQIYSHDAWIKSKMGDAGHWLYNLFKRLNFQVVNVDHVLFTGDLKEDLKAYLNDPERSQYVYTMVRVPLGEGRFDFRPIRLRRGAIAADAAAHRRITPKRGRLHRLVEVVPAEQDMAEWETRPLDPSTPIQPGMIIGVVNEPFPTGLQTLAEVVNRAMHRRTMLMLHIELGAARGTPSEILDAMANEGMNLVRSEFSRTENGAEIFKNVTDWQSDDRRSFLANTLRSFLKSINKFLGSAPDEPKVPLLFPLAKKWGLLDAKEVFAYLATIKENKDIFNRALGAVIVSLTDEHLKPRFELTPEAITLFVNGKYNRPGLIREISRILKMYNLDIMPNVPTHETRWGFQMDFILRPDTIIGQRTVLKVLKEVQQIPDSPQEGEAVILLVDFKGQDLNSVMQSINEISDMVQISFKGVVEDSEDLKTIRVSVPVQYESTLQREMDQRFPYGQVSVRREVQPVLQKNIELLLVFGMGMILSLFLPQIGVFDPSLAVNSFDFLLHPMAALGAVFTGSGAMGEGIGWATAGLGMMGTMRVFGAAESAMEPYWQYEKILRAVSRDISFAISENEKTLRVLRGEADSILVQRNMRNIIEITLPESMIKKFGKSDANFPFRNLEGNYIGYIRTQIHTAILAGLARNHFTQEDQLSSLDSAIENIGLDEAGVRLLFESGQSDQETIRRLQEEKYRMLMATFASTPVGTTVTANDVFPVTQVPFASMLGVNGMVYSEGTRNNDDLGRLTEHLLTGPNSGVNMENIRDNVWSLAQTQPRLQDSEIDFKPNLIAQNLDGLIRKNNVSVREVREMLAVSTLTNIRGWLGGAFDKNKLNEMWRALALLVGLDGSLSEGRNVTAENEKSIHWMREHFQLLDVQLLTNLANSRGNLDMDGSVASDGWVAFNNAASQAAALRNPLQALSEGFNEGQDLLIYLSPSMVLKNGMELTPEEKTQVELINMLLERLRDDSDREANEWKGKNKKIILAVLDPARGIYGNEGEIYRNLVTRGVNHSKLFDRKRELGNRFKTTVFSADSENNTVRAKTEFEKLSIDKVSLFALDVPNVTVDYSGVKNQIVSFIIALAGGLMCQVGQSMTNFQKARNALVTSA